MKAFIILALGATQVFNIESNVDSLINLTKDPNLTDSTKINIYNNLIDKYLYKNLDSALLFSDLGEQLVVESENQIEYGNFQLSKAIVYYFKSRDDSALHYLDKASTVFRKENHQKGLLRTSNNLGLVHSNMGNYDVALKHYLEAIKTAEQLNDYYMLASLNYNAGIVYSYQNQEREALKYYWTAYNYNREHGGDDHSQLNFLTGIGSSYAILNIYDSAEYFLKKALKLAKRQGKDLSIADLYQSLGTLNLDLGRLDSAYFYYTLSEEINTRTDNKYLLSLNYQGMSAYYSKLYEQTWDKHNLTESNNYALKLVELALELNNAERLLQGYEKVWKATQKLGDNKTALDYHIKHSHLKDSLFAKEKADQIIAMKEKYETEKKERTIAIQQTELIQQTSQRNFLIAGVIFLALAGALVYRSERLKTRKNRQIESLLKEIHHRVKNNLQVISSLLNMQSRKVEDEETLEAIREGQNRVKAMSLIHQKLYQHDNLNEIDFQEYARELSKQLAAVFNQSNREIRNVVNGAIKLDIDAAVPIGLILNELVSNAYKYAFENQRKGKIHINLDRTDSGDLELKVKDDGQGIPADFDPKKANSLGLKLVSILTKQLKGSWEYHTGNGTEFLIRFKEVATAS